jgi:calcium-translocating P-type ATPase
VAGPGELPATGVTPAWHALDAASVLTALDSGPTGLASATARDRLSRVGPNRLPAPPRRGVLRRLLAQFHNVLIYVLVAAGVASLLLGHVLDAAVIFGVVLINAVVGFVQEGRAEEALDAIRRLIDPTVAVLRDGDRVTVPADSVVPGDVVLINPGDRVPADLRLLKASSLRVDEAVLTGESVPVDKSVAPVADAVPLGERTSMLYSGTLVVAGQGAGVVVATAAGTELGHISQLLGRVTVLETPLLRQMARFGRQLTASILVVAGGTLAFAVGVRGYAVVDAFMAAVGLAVAAVPEGLPAVMTIAMAIGVQRMASRHAIVRRLPAVEALGSVAVICSDKTGTLTRNEMVVQAVVTAGSAYEVSGDGYAPEGALTAAGNTIDPVTVPALEGLLVAAALCNDAELREIGGAWRVEGDPMEGALLTLATKAGLDRGQLRNTLPRLDEIPFDAALRYMATLHAADDGAVVFVKGAPERLLELCSRERAAGGDRPVDHAAWQARVAALAARGQRVLAFAAGHAVAGRSTLGPDDLADGLVLLGLVGLIDPPRREAIEAIAECMAAGVRVVMITGDHAGTARAIAVQLGLGEDPQVLTGDRLDGLDDAALRDAARTVTVFARTTPEHKLRLVEALQADGLVVAMTGDGVNDAPALKRADVGVAMGVNGTEAAKEAAELVLADDNFASIVAAVREGRTVYDNLTKTVAWALPTNFGEAMTIVAAILAGLPLPVTPVQVLWINTVTAITLGLALAFEPTEPGTMRRPPRPASAPLLNGELAWRVLLVAGLFVAGAFGVFYWAQSRGLPLEVARTMVVNTIVAIETFYLFSVRYVHGPSLTRAGLSGTPAVLLAVGLVAAAQAAFTWLPPLQSAFGTQPAGLVENLVVVGVGLAAFAVVEADKALRRGWSGQAPSRRDPVSIGP